MTLVESLKQLLSWSLVFRFTILDETHLQPKPP